MKRWLFRLVGLGLLAGLGIGAWRWWHPSPEQAVRQRLAELARTVTVSPQESALTKVAKFQKLAAFFTDDVEIAVDVPGHSVWTLNGRDELMDAIRARSMLRPITVKFVDVSVTLGPDGGSAAAHFTAVADVPGENVPQVQEMKVGLRHVQGDWLIRRAETVRTLR